MASTNESFSNFNIVFEHLFHSEHMPIKKCFLFVVCQLYYL